MDRFADLKPIGRSARRRLLSPGCLAAVALLPGCSVVEPVKPASSWYLQAAAAAIDDCAASAADCRSRAGEAERYAGGLGRMIEQVDRRRAELALRSAAVTNTNVTYNALLWPLGALVMLSKLHTPSESLLLPATLAAGSYGFLSASIPDREKLDLVASRVLGCAVMGSSVYLYARNDINGGDEPTERDQQAFDDRTLDGARAVLRGKLAAMRTARAEFRRAVAAPQTSSAPRFANSLEQRAREARGERAGGGTAKDPVEKIEEFNAQQLAMAGDRLLRLNQLRTRVMNEKDALLERWQRVENGLQTELTLRSPQPARFQAVLGALDAKTLLPDAPAGTAAPAGGSGTANGRPRELRDQDDWSVPRALARLVPRTYADKLEKIDVAALQLQTATQAADQWLAVDQTRRAQMKAVLDRHGCNADAVITLEPRPSGTTPPSSNDNQGSSGGRPATPNTPLPEPKNG